MPVESVDVDCEGVDPTARSMLSTRRGRPRSHGPDRRRHGGADRSRTLRASSQRSVASFGRAGSGAYRCHRACRQSCRPLGRRFCAGDRRRVHRSRRADLHATSHEGFRQTEMCGLGLVLVESSRFQSLDRSCSGIPARPAMRSSLRGQTCSGTVRRRTWCVPVERRAAAALPSATAFR
jgi:hypothetical protein